MTTRLTVIYIGAWLLLATVPAGAHHSFAAQYDGNKPVTLRGTINRMLWSNPHGHLYVDVTTPDGKVVTWELETSAPFALYRRGWKKEDLPVGEQVIVKGYLSRDGTPSANATTVLVVSTGKELFAASPGGPDEPPREAPGARN